MTSRLKAIAYWPWQPWLLLGWMLLGAVLRFANLTSKPLWTDEFATIVFSLGHSFQAVPLDQPISADTLLVPLRYTPSTGISDVVHHLLDESNHPPLYFILTHLWLQLLSAFGVVQSGELVSMWSVRSLSALIGVATIPAIFGLSWLAFRSRRVSHMAAALMAISPFGIYLAQEARHYTLPIIWIMASLACLLLAVQALFDRASLPFWVCGVWIIVNGLGLATHYFVSISLVAQGLVLIGIAIIQRVKRRTAAVPYQSCLETLQPLTKENSYSFLKDVDAPQPFFNPVSDSAHQIVWPRIALVAVGTLASGLVWLPFLQRTQDNELTRWIYRDRAGLSLLEPIAQAIGGWITMLYLLPIQANVRWMAIASIVALLLMAIWTVPHLVCGIRTAWKYSSQPSLVALGGFVGVAIALFFAITYGLGMDVTSAFRYNFVYFPAVLVLVAVSLTYRWRAGHRSAVLVIALVSILGALTVITNLGYQKTHRPDLVLQAMQEQSQNPMLMAIAHRTHGQTGRLMGLAWEWKRTKSSEAIASPLFLLAHQDEDERTPIRVLRRSLASLPRPLDLWLINVQTVPEPPLQAMLKQQTCLETDERDSVDGYRYTLYRCQ
jgi:uncharacterized membrane protein